MTFEGFDFTVIVGHATGLGWLAKALRDGRVIYCGEYRATFKEATDNLFKHFAEH